MIETAIDAVYVGALIVGPFVSGMMYLSEIGKNVREFEKSKLVEMSSDANSIKKLIN